MADTDSPEDVNDFLRRVQELKVQRDQEDEERNRKLEEEILKSREERQARRAERARSLSPNKSSPVNTPPPPSIKSSNGNAALLSHSQTFAPPSSESENFTNSPSPVDLALERLTGYSLPSPKDELSVSRVPMMESDNMNNTPTRSPSSQEPLKRAPTLSWQQRRPPSQLSNRPQSRSLSKVAAESTARSPRATPDVDDDSLGRSRSEIAQSLSSKDPGWFRQTADRGANSAAYRRNQVEDEDVLDHLAASSSPRMQLPGMSRQGSREPEKVVETSPTTRTPTSSINRPARISSPVPLAPPERLEPLLPDNNLTSGERRIAMSPSQGRISPERLERSDRPPSPTKGAGGFVQSAMLKRSDSVSKRWSVQSPPGLGRMNSTRGDRGSRDLTAVMRAGGVLSPAGDNYFDSRPSSSHSNATITVDDRPGTSNSTATTMTSSMSDPFIKPTIPASRSAPRLASENMDGQDSTHLESMSPILLPTSPSRTMDPRRWSPTKSSWLESALNKPDSPKPKPQSPVPQQPSWMAEIAKAKQRAIAEPARETTPTRKHEVNIGGLMRSGPPGASHKPASLSRYPSPASSIPKPAPLKPAKPNIETSSPKLAKDDRTDKMATKDSPGSMSPTPASLVTPTGIAKPSPSAAKPKPETPPKPSFRTNLQSRGPPPKSNEPEPEFKSVFGQLRKTKTQNYVAPDELKDNILRGKAGLTVTGGPKKTERVDEFKEAILAKKKGFEKVQLEGKGVTRPAPDEKVSRPMPEALLRKKSLGRPEVLPASVQEALQESAKLRESKSSRQDVEVPAASSKPSVPQKSSNIAGRPQNNDTELISNKFADRFNPGLAGLLARGPPAASSVAANSSPRTTSPERPTTSTQETSGTGPQLNHMTKGRARGPRRKAPTSAAKSTTPNPSSPVVTPLSPKKLDPERRSQFFEDVVNQTKATPVTPTPLSPKFAEREAKPEPSLGSPIQMKLKPVPGPKSPNLMKMTNGSSENSTQSATLEKVLLSPSPLDLNDSDSSGYSPRPIPIKANSLTSPRFSLLPLRSPRSSPSRASRFAVTPYASSPLSPPSRESFTSASEMFADFFEGSPNIDDCDIDAAVFLLTKADYSATVDTNSAEIVFITSNAERAPVPSHQQRVLFEKEMYICTHTFTIPDKKVTEVYLWFGDAVPYWHVLNAEILARQEALNVGGTLKMIRQGQETPEFMQALGGIVITRRGSRYNSSQSYILCGRRFSGQITFDEVDFSAQSLCSGFPYLIFTPSGECVLWKGKGSLVDEMSCAMLIGQELSGGNDIEVVEDGLEPVHFKSIFKENKIPVSASHWKLRKNHGNYDVRLFRVDAAAKEKVKELVPFTQADISPNHIQVLDAFFEIYIIVGARAYDQYDSFRAALSFVQEYAILAASMEDRPFVPVSKVLMEGMPRDLKRVFRHWSDAKDVNAMLVPKPGVNRGKSLIKVVSLRDALEAVGG